MRIAVLVGAFPTVSETFILNQVTGLLDRGHDVRIFAGKVGSPAVIHSDIVTYGLMDRVRYSAELPDEYPRRFMAALPRNHAERVQKFQLRDEGIVDDVWDRDAHGYTVAR